MNKLFIIIGKSASGKSTIANYLHKHYGFDEVINFTTRPIRINEKNGVDYHFINDNIFSDMMANDEFINYKEQPIYINNKLDIYYYGTHKEKNNINLDENNAVIVIDPQGAKSLINYFGRENCRVVYIKCSNNIRKRRAMKRGSFSLKEWNRRLEADKKDFQWENIKDIVDIKIKNENIHLHKLCENIMF